MTLRVGVVSVAAASVVLTVTGLFLPVVANPGGAAPPASDPLDTLFVLIFALLVAGLAAVGAIVAIRRPDHPIGWLFLVAGALAAHGIFGGALSGFELWGSGEPAQWAVILGWTARWTLAPVIGILVFVVPLLFPTGRLLSPRWRPLLWLIVLAFAATTTVTALSAGDLEGTDGIPNPFGIEALTPAFDLINVVLGVTAAPMLAGVLVSLVLRYRRAGGAERVQLRWFGYPVSAAVLAFAVAFSGVPLPALVDGAWTIGLGAIALIPPAVGVAILRHRLFEIDRVISRTLTYAIVTALLAGVYLLTVLVLQGALAPIIGTDSPVVIAGSTLLVAALFRRVLRRVQAVVDLRFNRARYDAKLTLEQFGARLRDEVDLDVLTIELAAAARRAMQPLGASVWLRTERGTRAGS